MLEQYVEPDVTFQQHADITFEDPTLDITGEALKPTSDSYRTLVQQWASTQPEPSKIVLPPRDPRRTPSVADYEAVAQRAVAQHDADWESLSDKQRCRIHELCVFFIADSKQSAQSSGVRPEAYVASRTQSVRF